jgi:signal transduction histidine kinase
MPGTSLGLFFSRDPVFILVTSEGGIEGLTTTGVIMSIGFMFAQILALPRIVQKWWKTRNTIDLSLMLAMGLWLMGALFGLFAWDPLQVAEILWMASIIAGFLLVAVVQFVTSILHPYKNLERLVNQRTRELNLSKQESEFYLNMWTHKMGNFLQGMITYLDILELASLNNEEDTKTRSAASDLSREAAMINQQVIQLTRIKESLDQTLWPVNLPEAFEDAIKSAAKLLGEDSFTAEFIHREALTVKGDNLLPLAFHSAIAFQVRNRVDNQPNIKISVGHSESPRSLKIACRGKQVPEELKRFIEGDELRGQIALDLDLFTIKLLMNRYSAQIKCSRDESTGENSCIFTFPPD